MFRGGRCCERESAGASDRDDRVSRSDGRVGGCFEPVGIRYRNIDGLKVFSHFLSPVSLVFP